MDTRQKSKKTSFEKILIELNHDEYPPPPPCANKEGSGKGKLAYKSSKNTVKYYSKNYQNPSFNPSDKPFIFCEKIGADFYAHLSRNIFLMAKTRINVHFSSQESTPSVSVCSKWDDNFHDFSRNSPELLEDKFVIDNPFSFYPTKLEVKGYLRLLIIAHFLNDLDATGANAGISLKPNTNEPILFKIDPGYAFSSGGGNGGWGVSMIFPAEDFRSRINLSTHMEKIKNSQVLRSELANAVNDIVNLTPEQICYLIKGDGSARQFNMIPFTDTFFSKQKMTLEEYQETLITKMIRRQNSMRKYYAEDLQWLKSTMELNMLPPLPEIIPTSKHRNSFCNII